MAEIKAEDVKTLRERTGLGMMECKKALVESQGDMQAAEQLLRVKSGAKASKMSARSATEGVIGISLSADGKQGAMVELNCETDFVAKNEDFANLATAIAQAALVSKPADIAELANMNIGGVTAEKARQDLIMKLGENMTIRRFALMSAKGKIATYKHGAKIGVMIDGEGGYEGLGKDLAMHIAASKPVCVQEREVPAELIENEKAVYRARAAESGKPAEIIEKMISGSLKKYLAEVTLLGQPFVKNPDISVGQLILEQKAQVHGFTLFVVGEGLEKKTTDFAAEVAATAATAAVAKG